MFLMSAVHNFVVSVIVPEKFKKMYHLKKNV